MGRRDGIEEFLKDVIGEKWVCMHELSYSLICENAIVIGSCAI